MASVRRKQSSRFWYACFTTPDGQRAQRSTNLTDRKLALKLAETFEETAMKMRTETQVRQVMSDIHERIHGSPLSSETLDSYYQQWIQRKAGEIAPTTHAAYKHAVGNFVAFLGHKRTQNLQYVMVADVAKWRDHVAARTSPTTANNHLKILRTFFESAWRENLTSDNPAAKVPVLKSQAGVRRPFGITELKDVLQNSNDEWKGIVLFGVYTGQRLKDIASLTWPQIDLQKFEMRLITSKTRRNQIVPLHPELIEYLKRQQTTNLSAAVFPHAYEIAVRRQDISPLSQQFHQILVQSKLALPRPPKRKSSGSGRSAPRVRNPLTFHSLRHTATTWLKDAGVSESVARDIIGHDSAEISRLYTHTGEVAKRDAVDRLPSLLSQVIPAQKASAIPEGYFRIATQLVRLKSDAA